MMELYRAPDWEAEQPFLSAIEHALQHMLRTTETVDRAGFCRRFQEIQQLDVPLTAFSPAMLFTFYAVSALARPVALLGLGTYVGLGFNMVVAGAVDASQRPVQAVGVDINAQATALAIDNTARMQDMHAVEYRVQSAEQALQERRDPIDLLFLDVDDPVWGKAAYAALLHTAWDFIIPGGLVLAHDAYVAQFAHDIKALDAVADATGVVRRCALPVDRAGLWLGVRA